MIVDFDGSLIPDHEARVSIFDGAFRYGDGLFTTFRSDRGGIHRFPDHVERLQRGCEILQIPFRCDATELRSRVRALLAANDLDHGNARVRIQISRGGDHEHDPLTADPSALQPVTCIDSRRLELTDPATPLRAISLPSEFARGAFATLKSSSYLASLMALRFARARGRDEALVFDEDDRALEGATSNVFVVRGNRVMTPPLEGGVLAGITRACVLELLRNSNGIVEETAIHREDLLRSDEVFFTNSVRGIQPVGALDDHVIGSGTRGTRTAELQSAYEQARIAGISSD